MEPNFLTVAVYGNRLVFHLTKMITKNYKLFTIGRLYFPSLFIIDKEGIIKYYTVNNLLCFISGNELIRILQSILYTKENLGHACPIDWKYSDKILSYHTLKSKIYFQTL